MYMRDTTRVCVCVCVCLCVCEKMPVQFKQAKESSKRAMITYRERELFNTTK